jgi:peptidoglycan hydrolase-like amidase
MIVGPARVVAGILAVLAIASCQSTPPQPGPASPLPVPVPAVAPTPTPTPTATPTPAARAEVQPPVVRVLLSVDGTGAPAFPEPGRRFQCTSGAVSATIRGPLEVVGGPPRPAVQVGAFARPENARETAGQLSRAGFACVLRESEQLIRVVVLGQEGESDAALLGRLKNAGVVDAIARPPAPAAEVVVRGEGGSELRGPDVRVTPVDPEPVLVGGKRVRGDFVILPGNPRPRVINVLNLEVYLRGVVPAEMGPRAFPALEALKAQAVAARTFTVAHIGEHADEGYDVCDTTMCQVYGGADAEQPMSNAAVAETKGEIATYAGKPIDALYHSTCAGHTEDGSAVFSLHDAPYLKGVPCRGERLVRLADGSATGPWLDATGRLALVAATAASALGVKPVAGVLATGLGGRPAGAGVPGLAAAFGLDRVGALLHLAHPSLGSDDVLSLLDIFHLPVGPPPRTGSGDWELAVVVRLAQLAGVLRAAPARVVAGDAGPRLVAEPPLADGRIPSRAVVVEHRDEGWRRGAVQAPTGSPAVAWLLGDRCLVVEVEPLESADGRSPWNWWVREMPLPEVARRLELKAVEGIEVTRRGVSGRALEVRVSEGGRSASTMAAYPFRLALGLPDTLFSVSLRKTSDGTVAHFVGRGWGHGVGMCQNGAYGLALGGSSYREILAAYYTGVTIEKWSGVMEGGK